MFLYDWSGYLDGWYAGGVLAVMAAEVERPHVARKVVHLAEGPRVEHDAGDLQGLERPGVEAAGLEVEDQDGGLVHGHWPHPPSPHSGPPQPPSSSASVPPPSAPASTSRTTILSPSASLTTL